MNKMFELRASVSSENLSAVLPVVQKIVGQNGSVEMTDNTIEVIATLSGEDSKDLNRELLSALRRVEKRTRLRAEWISNDEVERYFDYVLKKREKTS